MPPIDIKTPGIYIAEKNAFPNSVVEVASAVPAFVGYTETAADGAASLRGKPWKINSLVDYTRYFGGLPKPRLRIEAVATGATEPVPDMAQARGQVRDFEQDGRRYRLTREAGRAGGRFLLPMAIRHFFENGGGSCYVVSVGGFDEDIKPGDAASGLIGGLTPLRDEPEPTLLAIPDAVLLPSAECAAVQQAMLAYCGQEGANRFALLDVWGGERAPNDAAGDCIAQFRRDLGPDCRDRGAAYYPWLHTTLVQANELDQGVFENGGTLAALLKPALALPDKPDVRSDDKTRRLIELIDDLGRSDVALSAKITRITPVGSVPPPLVLPMPFPPPTEPAQIVGYLTDYKRAAQQAALAASPLYQRLMDEARALLNLVPPSAAMAGVIAMIDTTRGVWKAPANVSLRGVLAPAVELNRPQQDDLNVSPSGVSVNAIRSFVGRGVLVWGARTLDGNSLDWRYISVRRTVLMIEASCRLALRAYVFEPNDANTWTTLRSMLTNYLNTLWKRGGLAGAKPDDAFAVQCGLGQTMSAQDLLDGRLRVTMQLALVRPAEFIVIRFEQQQTTA